MTIQIKAEGRRFYLLGNTYPLRDKLRSAGCKWDPDQKAWWTGKRETAESLVTAAASSSTGSAEGGASETVDVDARVIRGRATYQGKTYYVLFAGDTKRGYGVRLCFRDGSRIFWAKEAEQVQIVKSYREPTSIAGLKEFAERRRAEDAGEVECRLCARYCTCDTGFCHHHHDGCDRCGAER